jgi:hypothetical protein
MEEEKIKELEEKGWIRTWMAFEVQGVSKEIVESAMKQHVSKIKNEKNTNVFKEDLKDAIKIKAPPQFKQRKINNLYSQVVEITLLTEDFETLTNIVINFGPSAVEVLGPKELKLTMRELQNVLNSVTDMMHKFAAAGLGGLLISGR